MKPHNQAKLYSPILLLWILSSCSHIPTVKDKIIGHYIDHGNGTITDTKTNLMWKKCTEGQTGNNCKGKPKLDNWVTAKQKAKQVNFAGYNDWRLPTHKELDSLIYCSNGATPPDYNPTTYMCRNFNNKPYQVPTINHQAFPNMVPIDGYVYWTSATLMFGDDPANARTVDFKEGLEVANLKTDLSQSRLVRSIKK